MKKYTYFLVIAFGFIVILSIKVLANMPQISIKSELVITPTILVNKFPADSLISHDATSAAYLIKKAGAWVPNKEIYIMAKNDQEIVKIPLNTIQDFEIIQWSSEDQYLFVLEKSQYYGGQVGHIIDVISQKQIYSFPILNNTISWIDQNTILYFDPYINCEALADKQDCYRFETGLIMYNLQTGKKLVLQIINPHDRNYPLIFDPILKHNSFSYGIGYNYIVQAANKYISIDLITLKVEER